MSETPLLNSGTPGSPGTKSPSATGTPTAPKRFMNGWSKEQDQLMADWADIAGCYRWMHDRAEKKYYVANLRMTVPVIVLSTLTGTASVGLSSIANGDKDLEKYLNFGIGGVSLIAAIITTLNNTLKYAQLSEANRVATIAWGKFQRLISVELALNPLERMDSLDFLKICRADLDRLIEQSPPIPDDVISAFENEFKDTTTLRRPDICHHGLDHTRIYDNSKARLKNLTSDAAIFLLQKKKMLRQEIVPDLNRMIESAVSDGIKSKQKELEESIASKLNSTDVKKGGATASTLFKASETDFRNLLDQRKRVIELTRGPSSADLLIKPIAESAVTTETIPSGAADNTYVDTVVQIAKDGNGKA